MRKPHEFKVKIKNNLIRPAELKRLHFVPFKREFRFYPDSRSKRTSATIEAEGGLHYIRVAFEPQDGGRYGEYHVALMLDFEALGNHPVPFYPVPFCPASSRPIPLHSSPSRSISSRPTPRPMTSHLISSNRVPPCPASSRLAITFTSPLSHTATLQRSSRSCPTSSTLLPLQVLRRYFSR